MPTVISNLISLCYQLMNVPAQWKQGNGWRQECRNQLSDYPWNDLFLPAVNRVKLMRMHCIVNLVYLFYSVHLLTQGNIQFDGVNTWKKKLKLP